MFTRIKNALLRRFIFKHFIPQMILGYKSQNGYLANTRISNTSIITHPHSLTISDNVFIGHFNFIDASGGLVIGEGCQICNHINIITHSSHIAIRLYGKEYIQNNGHHKGYILNKTSIGMYTFIGPNSVIMPGVTIGKGSIVSAFSYVKRGTYPDFAILAGNPATIVGDTRMIDEAYLSDNPELRGYYDEWAKL